MKNAPPHIFKLPAEKRLHNAVAWASRPCSHTNTCADKEHGQDAHATFETVSKRCRGTTLIEAMMLMVIMSLVVMGVGVSLQSLIKVPEGNNGTLAVSSLMIDKVEKLRALPFATLSSTASSSDTVTIDNVTYTRSWTITSNPGGVYDAKFIQIKVTIGTRSLTTAVCQQ